MRRAQARPAGGPAQPSPFDVTTRLSRVGPSTTRASAGGPPSPDKLGEDFSNAALRLAGLAGAVLGWGPDAFWRATPAELGAVLRAVAGEDAGAAPPDGATVERLRGMFPDG